RLQPFVNHYQDSQSYVVPALNTVQIYLPYKSTGVQLYKVLFRFPMLMPFNWESRV
ncbi:hypothetical protein N657DRAFT_711395, partial [Parathielavia appendiculata]